MLNQQKVEIELLSYLIEKLEESCLKIQADEDIHQYFEQFSITKQIIVTSIRNCLEDTAYNGLKNIYEYVCRVQQQDNTQNKTDKVVKHLNYHGKIVTFTYISNANKLKEENKQKQNRNSEQFLAKRNNLSNDQFQKINKLDRLSKSEKEKQNKSEESRSINAKAINMIIRFLVEWVTKLNLYNIFNLVEEKDYQVKPIRRAITIFEMQSKLQSMKTILLVALFAENDIAMEQRFATNKYEHVERNMVLNNHGNQDQIRLSYQNMKKLMVITNSAVIAELHSNYCLTKILTFGFSFPRFFIDHQEAELRNNFFLRDPDIYTAQSIWNLPEKGAIGKLKSVIFQSITTNQQLYFPVKFEETDLPDIHQTHQNQQKILVRLLHHEKVYFKRKPIKYSSCCEKLQNEFEDIQTIIIHAHGGGFIALSSSSMQSYTRRWANSLKVPIFSVDYRKPPNHVFPEPLDDMVAVYRFITEKISEYINMKPKRVILAGDSAGGNLICSLMGLILKHNLHPVDGVLLAYPALDMRKSIFSPSKLNSFNDAVLYPTLLLLCLDSYLNNNQLNQYHPLASPLLLTEEFVNGKVGDRRLPLKWPPTILMTGRKDSLHDDAIRFCEKLANSNIPFHCEIYKNLSHGFLSLDKMIPECQQTILDSIIFLGRLIAKQI